MKKIITSVLVMVLVFACARVAPKVVHKCDDCGNYFVGAGYEANVVEDMLTDEEQIICKECAEKQHAVAIALGKSVEDYKRDLFE